MGLSSSLRFPPVRGDLTGQWADFKIFPPKIFKKERNQEAELKMFDFPLNLIFILCNYEILTTVNGRRGGMNVQLPFHALHLGPGGGSADIAPIDQGLADADHHLLLFHSFSNPPGLGPLTITHNAQPGKKPMEKSLKQNVEKTSNFEPTIPKLSLPPAPSSEEIDNLSSFENTQEVRKKGKNREESLLKRIRSQILEELRSLAHLTVHSFSNVTHAATVLMGDLTNQTISLAGVIAYLPELILLDGPDQLLETLKIIRNQSRNETLSSLDTLILFLEGDSEHTEKIRKHIKPAISFLPQVVQSVGAFIHAILEAISDLFE